MHRPTLLIRQILAKYERPIRHESNSVAQNFAFVDQTVNGAKFAIAKPPDLIAETIKDLLAYRSSNVKGLSRKTTPQSSCT
ncbi:MAG: hypothetical protein DI637_01425 [Citromicrobium sp.]|nr:MAG: hypothetical protein DI637_01425 [Citromicrobium sp.]